MRFLCDEDEEEEEEDDDDDDDTGIKDDTDIEDTSIDDLLTTIANMCPPIIEHQCFTW